MSRPRFTAGPTHAPRAGARALALALVVVIGAPATAARAVAASSAITTPALLQQLFAHSDKVGFVRVDDGGRGGRPQTVYVATTGARVDGYAVVLDEVGQHEPITFGVQVGVDGRVQRVEVMAYREAYGHEIRSPRYLRQFVGRNLAELGDGVRVAGVDAISGATISCRSAGRAVRRALALVQAATAQGLPPAAPTNGR